jgi:hypothetical protein
VIFFSLPKSTAIRRQEEKKAESQSLPRLTHRLAGKPNRQQKIKLRRRRETQEI